jgi:hypothetical protein
VLAVIAARSQYAGCEFLRAPMTRVASPRQPLEGECAG